MQFPWSIFLIISFARSQFFSFNEHKAQQQSNESNEEPDSNKSVDDGASVKKYLYYQDWQLTLPLICFSSKPTLELNHSQKKKEKKEEQQIKFTRGMHFTDYYT